MVRQQRRGRACFIVVGFGGLDDGGGVGVKWVITDVADFGEHQDLTGLGYGLL